MPTLAIDLLLIGRSPLSGRLRNRSALEKGLRAALFAELILAGRIGTVDNAPHALTAEPLEDRVLDTVLAAVAAKPGIAWWRWYRHVGADRSVLTKTLIEDGRWQRGRDQLGRAIYQDHDQAATLVLAHSTMQVAGLTEPPGGHHRALLAVLAVLCAAVDGRPQPRDRRKRLEPLLDTIGPPSDPLRRDLAAALTGCATAIRRRPRILG